MAKGKNYSKKRFGYPASRQLKHPRLELYAGKHPPKNADFAIPLPLFASQAKTATPPFLGSSQLTPLEADVMRYLLGMPVLSARPPEGMEEEDYRHISIICETMEDQGDVMKEIYERSVQYRTQAGLSLDDSHQRLHFFPMDAMEKEGENGHSVEELADFSLAQIYDRYDEEIVIALTSLSQQLLVALKERAEKYPDHGQRFFTLTEALGDDTGKLSDPTIRQRYIDAALQHLYNS